MGLGCGNNSCLWIILLLIIVCCCCNNGSGRSGCGCGLSNNDCCCD